MKHNSGRFISIILALAVAAGFPASVAAEELGAGSETGVGEVEGSINTDVYEVVLPAVTDEIFDFIIDPHSLLNHTNGAAYEGKTFKENSTLFFQRSAGTAEADYSNVSDPVTITNMSSKAINVSVDISIDKSSLGGITLTGDKEFTDDTSASIYMALVDGVNEVPIGSDGISMEALIGAAPEEAYEYRYDSESGEYSYGLTGDTSGIEFGIYSFQLTGAANGNGDWSGAMEAKPQIKVVWRIMPGE